ncbi:hypothetical protein IFM89_038274 [Coptis chinensis]|uniref:Uncharacterized protein n=1 Tax=Coptis chinensis TaxID=261450 RepID=A0A835IJY9_9MAGN|nr:hypothetical protein IFM89_038274 [Coptis chinensis]
MEKENNTSTISVAMNGGDGINSYANNSSFQKVAVDGAKGMIREAIKEKLDIQQMFSSFPSKTICIADLGCSVGPNTFTAVQNIIEEIEHKYYSQGLSLQIPEFQVFFNDHVCNDFNKLLTSLPSERQYFAAAVPGSFYNRLFPKASLHFVHSSYSLQWLSKIPKEVEDVNSPAWNKGRISYGDAPKEVVEAFSNQYVKDVETFLWARAQEVVSGGLVALILPTYPMETLSEKSFPLSVDLLGTCLMEMAKKGLVSESEVDSFNVPCYVPSVKELEKAIKSNGCFGVERLELLKTKGGLDAQTISMHHRAALEGLISKNFGAEITDELFALFADKLAEYSHFYNPENRIFADLFVLLKKK